MVTIINDIKNEEDFQNIDVNPPKNKQQIDYNHIDWSGVTDVSRDILERHKEVIKKNLK